ncbi:MAG: [FeFe] hydrogenase H-cluster radical SAM maturase HydE, partial [bacterium]|nr:[FeFe] hydrogenase H-cluster radical SAM maturase HydE [bacterium]
IRAGNRNADRYRLSQEQILECAAEGYSLGYRTFVLQGGEDPFYSDEAICSIVSELKGRYPDCAVTLSIGERSRESYQAYFDAGASRYLLRHETAEPEHYSKLHPDSMSLENRKRCLWNLKEIGYQVGSGFMVGSPYQTLNNIVADLLFLKELSPDMIGIGPFIHHNDTPFSDFPDGDVKLTLRIISVLRIMFPYALIPATTALGTLSPTGREDGLRAGANVVMPNLSPVSVREKYSLYENKICTGEESAQCRHCLEKRVFYSGYRIVTARGDVKRQAEDEN